MGRPIVALVLVALFAGGVVGLAGLLVAPPAGEAYDQVVELDDFFTPQVIRVPAGGTVAWVNRGRNTHTVTADDGTFDSGIMQRGDEYSHTYTAPGIYHFTCVLHGKKGGVGMAGIVVVGDAALTGNGAGGAGGVGPRSEEHNV